MPALPARSTKARKPEIPRPETWGPNEKHREIAEKNGISLDGEREKFVDHHDARASRFADWDAAFRTWLRNAPEFRRSSHGLSPPPGFVDHAARQAHERAQHRTWLVQAAKDGQFGSRAQQQALAGIIDIAKLETHYDRIRRREFAEERPEPACLAEVLPGDAPPIGKAHVG